MNAPSTIDLARISTMDLAHAARLLKGVRDATLSGQRPRVMPRPVIGESWGRMLTVGVDPDRDVRSRLLSEEELEERRRASPLLPILPGLREALVTVADAAQHIMVVCDADGRVLWREGSSAVLRKADTLGFEPGADWSEGVVGTNGVGTPLVVRRPVQVFSAEHFVRTHHSWTCTGAPVTDPRDGTLLGVVDVSGPLRTMHPATLALVDSVAKLAEARLRERHVAALERLRAGEGRPGPRAPGGPGPRRGRARLDRRGDGHARGGPAAAAQGPRGGPRLAALAGHLPGGAAARRLAAASGGPVRDAVPLPATRVVLDVSGARRWTLAMLGGAATGPTT